MTKIEKLVASLDKSTEKVEKQNKSIERHKKQLDKMTSKLKKQGLQFDNVNELEQFKYDGEKGSQYYWAITDIENKLETIENAYDKLKEMEQVTVNWKEKVLDEKSKIEYVKNEVPQIIIEFVDKWKEDTKQWYVLNKQVDPKKLESMLENEKQLKVIQLTSKVSAVVGKITDASYLRIAENGDINGIVKGEQGKAKVETISAGGWNIQKYHYRVLVEKL